MSYKKIMLRTFAKSVYEEKDFVSENQFVSMAETGDILLFHTKNTGAKLQRFFTNSDYDHVAMILKPPGQP